MRLTPYVGVSLVQLFVLIFTPVPAASSGAHLVAHYDFNEGSGNRLRDVSGNGNDGEIVGAVYGSSPHGYALRFDGKDDFVRIDDSLRTNFKENITIIARIKPAALNGRNLLIFGDTARLAVNRNFNLNISKGRLCFEYAHGNETRKIFQPDLLEKEKWQHVACVVEYPRYYLYRNGVRTGGGSLDLPVSPTKGGAWHIGGWSAGFFSGHIDELLLYKGAISERSVREHYQGYDDGKSVQQSIIKVKKAHKDKIISVSCLFSGIREMPGFVRFDIQNQKNGRVLQRKRAKAVRTGINTERITANATLHVQDYAADIYKIVATLYAENNKRVFAGSVLYEHRTKPPEWYKSKVGHSGAVVAPYSPIALRKSDHDGLIVNPSGRIYEFGNSPFFRRLKSRNKEILAKPVRIKSVIDGQPVEWRYNPVKVLKNTPGEIILSHRYEGKKVDVTARTTIAYDGFVRTRWQLSAKQSIKIQQLALESLFARDVAKYCYIWPDWPRTQSGALEKNLTSAFKPMVWIGDDERGMQWVCESEQNWHPRGSKRAIQVVLNGDLVSFCVNLVDGMKILEAGQDLHYEFGYQVTPVKPVLKDAWDYRIIRNPYYGHSLSITDKMFGGRSLLEHFADRGARAMLVWRFWEPFAHTKPLGYEAPFNDLITAAHAEKMKIVPYVGGFVMSELAPESKEYKDEMAVKPLIPYPISMPGLKSQMGYGVCPRGGWQDWLVDGIGKLIDEYNIDGVYLDSTAVPRACKNQLHGCGYQQPDGSFGATYPVFATRKLLQRIHYEVKSRKPDGIVDMHVGDCMNALALAYCTSYWIGEQLPKKVRFKPDGLPIDRFRAEFMGYNWGAPADFLYYMIGGNRQCWAMTLIHDVPVRSENLKDLETQSLLWNIREQFSVKQAEWLPYWKNQAYATVSPDECYASLYSHKKKGVLVFVSNLSDKSVQVQVHLNSKNLNLKPPLSIRQSVGGTGVALEGTVLTGHLSSQDWRAIWVTSSR